MSNIDRFAAIDGHAVEKAALVKDGMISVDLNYSDGALGNALSHVTLWELAIEQKQSLTVCEDDAVFHHSFFGLSKALLEELPPDWHFVLWGWNFDALLWFDMIPDVSSCVGLFDQPALRKNLKHFQSTNLHPRPFRLFQAFGTVCYSISSIGAQLLRESIVPFRNSGIYIPGMKATLANTNLDIALNGIYSSKNCFLSFPPLVVTENDHSISTVVPK
jgi:glycosyl transferase family 25